MNPYHNLHTIVAATLVADNSPVKQVYMRFAVSGFLSDQFTLSSAKLRLTAGSASAASSPVGGTVQTIVAGRLTWSEEATTFANKPAVDGPVLDSVAAVAANQVVDFDVTRAVTADGTISFAVTSTSTDDVVYQSREASSGQPQLVLTLHVTFSVGWLGIVVAYLALAIGSLKSQNDQSVRVAYMAMELIGWYVIVPFSLVTLAVGLVQALGTEWGLFRHYWISVKFVLALKRSVRELGLVTVCEEAGCPNLSDCWADGTATFMVLGERCTRACGFCLVDTRKPGAVDETEPERVAGEIGELLAEIELRRLGDAEDALGAALSEIDLVQIVLEDLLLRVSALGGDRHDELARLPADGGIVGLEIHDQPAAADAHATDARFVEQAPGQLPFGLGQ